MFPPLIILTAFVPTDSGPARMVCILILFASMFSAFIVSGEDMMQNHNSNVISVANFAMNFHNLMSSYPYAFKVVDIISETTQVSVIHHVTDTHLLYSDGFANNVCLLQLYPPALVKYMLQIQAEQTVCKNQASVNLTHCALQSNAEVRNNI